MSQKADVDFHLYSPRAFLQHASTNLEIDIDPDTLAEMKEASEDPAPASSPRPEPLERLRDAYLRNLLLQYKLPESLPSTPELERLQREIDALTAVGRAVDLREYLRAAGSAVDPTEYLDAVGSAAYPRQLLDADTADILDRFRELERRASRLRHLGSHHAHRPGPHTSAEGPPGPSPEDPEARSNDRDDHGPHSGENDEDNDDNHKHPNGQPAEPE